jgi:hypothetical protein
MGDFNALSQTEHCLQTVRGLLNYRVASARMIWLRNFKACGRPDTSIKVLSQDYFGGTGENLSEWLSVPVQIRTGNSRSVPFKDFPTKTLCSFSISHKRATCSAHQLLIMRFLSGPCCTFLTVKLEHKITFVSLIVVTYFCYPIFGAVTQSFYECICSSRELVLQRIREVLGRRNRLLCFGTTRAAQVTRKLGRYTDSRVIS